MSVSPITVTDLYQNTNALLFDGAVNQGVNKQIDDLNSAMTALAKRDPTALAKDTLFGAHAKRLKQLEVQLQQLKDFGSTSRRGWFTKQAGAMRSEYRKLLGAMEMRAKVLLDKYPAQAQAEAGKRYGDAGAAAVGSVVDSGLPFDLMLLMLAAKLSDQYEKKMKGIMSQLEQVSSGQGGKNIAKALVGTVAGAVGGAVGGPVGGAAAAGLVTAVGSAVESATEGSQKSETSLKAELQYWNNKYTNTTTMLSGLLKAANDRQAAIGRNIG